MKKGEERKRATRESEITAASAALGKKRSVFCIRGLDEGLNASETLQRWSCCRLLLSDACAATG